MTTDFRALCAELVEAVLPDDRLFDCAALVARARAALAEPVPERPTTEELHQVFLDHSGYIDDEQVMWSGRFCVAARAVLARWGHPATLAPQPAPVSERSPEVTDCDALGRCWCYGEGGDMFGWTCIEPSEFYYYSATHWLPFTALPLPTVGHTPNA